MKTIQQIFNTVIQSGLYDVESWQWLEVGGKCMYASDWMCGALVDAFHVGLITHDEYVAAKRAIDEYLPLGGFLANALIMAGYDAEFNDRLAIYKDWSNRPEL